MVLQFTINKLFPARQETHTIPALFLITNTIQMSSSSVQNLKWQVKKKKEEEMTSATFKLCHDMVTQGVLSLH